jgi:3-phosphoshikimate 1-carboxyvinyltransferase
MALTISKENRNIIGKIQLPPSKSESARLLIIDAILGKEDLDIENLSESSDTLIMKLALESLLHLKGTNISLNLDLRDSGTAMRFITAYASGINVKSYITGSERMKQRPIGILVDKLVELGTNIEYTEKVGFPPILIEGKRIKGGEIEVDATVSSQFISALLLMAPKMTNGLKLTLLGEVSSAPYIEMTLKIMQEFDIQIQRKENTITIEKQRYQNKKPYRVESDWTAASYWYEMAAFADELDLTLMGLKKESMQGDRVMAEIGSLFGIHTEFTSEGVRLTKTTKQISPFKMNFYEFPDLAQTAIVSVAGLNISGEFTGLQNLRLKETDRIAALEKELSALGASIQVSDEKIVLSSAKLEAKTKIYSHSDHRMAMAFAPLSMLLGELKIDNPSVVNKSYPNFWKDLESVGFRLKQD